MGVYVQPALCFFEAMAMVFQKFPLGFMGGVAGWAW